MAIIAPSILSADFSNLAKDIQLLDKSEAEWIHIDIMDGNFVPNISFGFPVIKSIRKFTNKTFDVHLMIANPDMYIKDFKDAGADLLNVHYEACTHLHRTISEIKSLGMKAGVALNPHTNVSLLDDIVKDLDLVLIMSVNPGFGGQKFIENTYNKVMKTKELILAKNSNALIQVDGGVAMDNARKLKDAGVDVLVAGSTVFNAENPTEMISKLRKA